MDTRVTELHYMTPIANVASILAQGILSHNLAKGIDHHSIADPDVQERRKVKDHNGRALHSHVNLYFNARNPMMYKRLEEAPGITVLRVDLDVMKLKGVVLTDRNAARGQARFLDVDDWQEIVFDDVFAKHWNYEDEDRKREHIGRMCAEVLVPDKVDPKYILGAHVVGDASKTVLGRLAPDLDVRITPFLFFRKERAVNAHLATRRVARKQR